MNPERGEEISANDDLGARIASAAVLAPLAIAAAVAGGPWLAGATGAAVVAMSYEWARMSEPRAVAPAWALAAIGALGAVMLASWGLSPWSLAWLGAWAAASGLRRPDAARFLETTGGVFYIGVPCVAFLWLRALPDGQRTILTLFAIIWSVDIAAYFAGRLIGGPLIWPAASPVKTWAGTVSGLALGLSAGYGCSLAFHGPALPWAGAGLAIGACGLAGDLFESLLKRRFGVKDAGRLIPGHGGVLDRVDSLMAATALAALALAGAPGLIRVLWEHPH